MNKKWKKTFLAVIINNECKKSKDIEIEIKYKIHTQIQKK